MLDLDGYFDGYDADAWFQRAIEFSDQGKPCLVGESCPVCHLAIPSWPRMIAARGQRYCSCNLADGVAIPIPAFGLLARHDLGAVAHLMGVDVTARSPLAR